MRIIKNKIDTCLRCGSKNITTINQTAMAQISDIKCNDCDHKYIEIIRFTPSKGTVYIYQ